ncbi:hypothetical protein [Massilia sp. ST3]|uniref:hypothetical protein n=1 Tax=Massilia sp. ST3 TaxID=2824903 RepID=UPI001B8331CE|nr:hypothetical protein [Massilia sp. ST3]MBQ5950505.1 hypothetical protein [Massilia sp. ST3]
MSDQSKDQGKEQAYMAVRRVPDPTLRGWLGILGLMAVVFAGALAIGRLLGRALYLVLH